MKKPRRWRHWAAIGKSGYLLRDLSGHLSIWKWRQRADIDCPAYGYVAQVEIREIKRRKWR